MIDVDVREQVKERHADTYSVARFDYRDQEVLPAIILLEFLTLLTLFKKLWYNDSLAPQARNLCREERIAR